ncbi:hypothetical protein [Streptomyces sp. NPDC005423]|uniref:hypothetical protein n=1 Tax=Streptomyces sp. NPDC005423 TaxID=3155343 RepID=UPI0033A61B72
MNGTYGVTASPPRRQSPAARGGAWLWFLTWLLVGAAGSLGLLTIPTVGVFLLPLAAAGAGVAAFRRGARAGLPGLLSGAGLPLMYVAYLNREGPGNVCTNSGTGGQSCVEEWNPWFWLAGGVALLVAGAVWFVLADRLRRTR